MPPDVFDDRLPTRSGLKNLIKSEVERPRGRRSRSRSSELVRSLLKHSTADLLSERDRTGSERPPPFNPSEKAKSALLFEGKYPAPAKAVPNSEHEEPKNFKKWIKRSIKGGFYFNQKLDGLVSNSYALELHDNASVYFTIETYKTDLNSSSF